MCKVVTSQSTIYWYYIIFWTLSDVSLSSHIAAHGSQRSPERQLTFHTFIKLWVYLWPQHGIWFRLLQVTCVFSSGELKLIITFVKEYSSLYLSLYLCSIIMVLVTTKYAYCDSILQKPVLLLEWNLRDWPRLHLMKKK